MPCICVQPLSHDGIAKAYGLMRLAMPTLSFDDWEAYAWKRLATPGIARIITVVDGRGYVMGVACFDIRHTLGRDQELVVEELVALGLFPAQIRAITDGLLEACVQVAAAQACDGLRLEVARPVSGAWSDAVGWLLRGRVDPSPGHHRVLVSPADVIGHA